MNACSLDMLHNSGDKHILAVAYAVNLKFRAHHIFVNKHRVFDALRKYDCHILLNIVVGVCDCHILTADYI